MSGTVNVSTIITNPSPIMKAPRWQNQLDQSATISHNLQIDLYVGVNHGNKWRNDAVLPLVQQ